MPCSNKILLIILFIFFCVTGVSTLNAQQLSNPTFSDQPNKVPFTAYLDKLEDEFDVKFYYKSNWFKADSVTGHFKNATLSEVIEDLIANKPFTYEVLNENKVVFLPREQVALVKGTMVNNAGGAGSDVSMKVIGDPLEAGKYDKVTVKGKVMDAKTQKPVTGATVKVLNSPKGSVTKSDGSYELEIKPGIYNLEVSSMSYEKSRYRIKVLSNGTLMIDLFEESKTIDEVVISAKRPDRNVSGNQMSVVNVNAEDIKKLPASMGETDVIKSLTAMPGVKSVGEFGSGINIRGGGEDQNLYMVEGAPIFNTTHIFGLLSVINPDAVSDLTLYKGHIPAKYGQRVSSVMDIKLRENTMDEIETKGKIGIYNSGVTVKGPAIEDKLNFKISGRSSYSDWLLNNINDYNLQNSSAFFYDANVSLDWKAKKDRFTFFGYNSYDRFRFADKLDYNYTNRLGSFQWNHTFNSVWNSNLKLSYSNYKANKKEINTTFENNNIHSSVRYLNGKYNFTYNGFSNHELEFGMQAIHYQINPGRRTPLDSSVIETKTLEQEKAAEGALYISDVYDVNDWFTLNAGVRMSGYALLGTQTTRLYEQGQPINDVSVIDSMVYKNNEMARSYHGIEPRLSAKFMLNSKTSVKASYSRNKQYINLLSNTSVSTPNDVWKLSDKYFKPVTANQWSLGFYKNFNNNIIETSAEFYYKQINNVVEYKNDAQVLMNEYPETAVVNANGNNYGAELMIEKKEGRLDGRISYTYSRALRQTDHPFSGEAINQNQVFPSSYDKPHDLTVVANYNPNRRWRISANFSMASGRPITLPEYKYTAYNNSFAYFSDRNKYRLPTYHRLDLSVTLNESLKKNKNFKSSWTFSVLNVYGRENPFSVFYKKSQPDVSNNYETFSLYQMLIIGNPLPTITYNFTFK